MPNGELSMSLDTAEGMACSERMFSNKALSLKYCEAVDEQRSLWSDATWEKIDEGVERKWERVKLTSPASSVGVLFLESMAADRVDEAE